MYFLPFFTAYFGVFVSHEVVVKSLGGPCSIIPSDSSIPGLAPPADSRVVASAIALFTRVEPSNDIFTLPGSVKEHRHRSIDGFEAVQKGYGLTCHLRGDYIASQILDMHDI